MVEAKSILRCHSNWDVKDSPKVLHYYGSEDLN